MVNLSSSVRTVHAGVPTNVWREPADSLFFGKGRLSRLVVPSSGKVKVMIFFGLASLFFGGEEPTRNQWLIQLDNSTSIVRRLQYSSLLLMLRCGVIRCLKCIPPLEAESITSLYALFHQLPRAILLELF